MKDLNNIDEFDEIVDDILDQRRYLKIQKYIESIHINGAQITLYDIQLDLIKFYCDNWSEDEMCILKTRQCVLTTVTLLFILSECVRNDNKYIIILTDSTVLNEIHKISSIIRICIDNDIKFKKITNGRININGNIIEALNSNKGSLNGNKRIVCFFDEYAYSYESVRIKNIESMLDNYNNVLMIFNSTPNGTNKFKHHYLNSKNKFKINWSDIPSRDEDWKNNVIKLLGSETMFRREYNNKFIILIILFIFVI